MKVFVYYNIRKRCWSVVDRSTGRVAMHADTVAVRDATFVVREAGRQRVLSSGRKNVHAGVRGVLTDVSHTPEWAVSYNPYRGPDFVVKATGEPVRHAPYVLLTGRECLI